jgi:DNA-binding Xre family transcriptional regulator
LDKGKRRIGMALSYNRMWKLLIDKKMSKADLRKAADIAPNTMTKLRRDEAVNLAILGRICDVLDCDFGDIMEYKKEPAEEKLAASE